MARTARLSTGGPDSALCSARTWVTNGVRTWVTLLRFTIGWPTRYHEGREMFARRCPMNPYSMDLRERVAAAVDLHEGSQRQIARRFRVSLSFITRLLRTRRRTGSLAPKPHGGGHPPALDRAGRVRLGRLVRKQPDATLEELAGRVGVRCRRMAIFRTLRKLEITRKKKSLQAQERDTPRVRRKRRAFRKEVATLDPASLVFVDETGANTAMTRAYGRAPRGQRVKGSVPGHWKSLTLSDCRY